jgi:hypothetical protein
MSKTSSDTASRDTARMNAGSIEPEGSGWTESVNGSPP